MTEDNRDALLESLADLAEDTPPLPEGFHAGWTKLVEENAMENRNDRSVSRRTLVRILSAAAALVFVVGGTLLSRDALNEPGAEGAPASVFRAAKRAANSAAGAMDFTMEAPAEFAMEAPAEYAMDEAGLDYAAGADMPESQPAKIIRTASLSVAVTDFDAAVNALRASCASFEGWVSFSSVDADSEGRRSAWFNLRIPSARLDEFLQGTGSLGLVTNRSETADDVSESYYDTAARLASQRALLERLQGMIKDADSLSDLLDLESKLAEIQATVDRLQSRLNSTDRQVDYATVSVSLREETPQDTLESGSMSLGERLSRALSIGWKALGGFIQDALVFLVAALPFAVIAAVVAVCTLLIVRRGKKK